MHGRLRLHVNGGKDLSINTVVDRQAVGRNASFYPGQYLFLVSAVNMSAVHWFRGASGTTRISSMPAFEAIKAIRPNRGPLLNAYVTDAWAGRVPGEACGAATRLLAFLSSYPIVTEHPPCCLLYTSPSPRDRQKARMPSSA